MQDQAKLLSLIQSSIKLSTGCTEPASIAYAAALAHSYLDGEIKSLALLMNSYIYKNALGVCIPGYDKKGVLAAAALGYALNNPQKELCLLDDVTPEHQDLANQLLSNQQVSYELIEDCDVFFIQVLLTTDKGRVRVTLAQSHQQIAEILHNAPNQFDVTLIHQDGPVQDSSILSCTLEDMIHFAKNVPVSSLLFLKEGLEVNLAAAKAGFEMMERNHIDMKTVFLENCPAETSLFTSPPALCMAASYARMSGKPVPVMTSTGSGNHGITLFLTLQGFATQKNLPEEKLLRALALGLLMNLYIKTQTGLLTAMCGCGIAAGIGASAGIVYLMQGSDKQILGSVRNLVGSISGILCDGAKEGCAYKLALCSGWAVQAAQLAMSGALIGNDGIVTEDFAQMIGNLSLVCTKGMSAANEVILQAISN